MNQGSSRSGLHRIALITALSVNVLPGSLSIGNDPHFGSIASAGDAAVSGTAAFAFLEDDTVCAGRNCPDPQPHSLWMGVATTAIESRKEPR